MSLPTPEYLQAFLSKDARFDGRFVAGVTTTGVYCKSSCFAKKPAAENIVFFDTPADAEAAGLSREQLEIHYEKRQTPRGTYAQVNDQLAGFEALGVSRFYFQGVFSPSDTGKLLDGLGVA